MGEGDSEGLKRQSTELRAPDSIKVAKGIEIVHTGGQEIKIEGLMLPSHVGLWEESTLLMSIQSSSSMPETLANYISAETATDTGTYLQVAGVEDMFRTSQAILEIHKEAGN